MAEEPLVQSLTRPLKRKRDFDLDKQHDLRIRCEQLAREILERSK